MNYIKNYIYNTFSRFTLIFNSRHFGCFTENMAKGETNTHRFIKKIIKSFVCFESSQDDIGTYVNYFNIIVFTYMWVYFKMSSNDAAMNQIELQYDQMQIKAAPVGGTAGGTEIKSI